MGPKSVITFFFFLIELNNVMSQYCFLICSLFAESVLKLKPTFHLLCPHSWEKRMPTWARVLVSLPACWEGKRQVGTLFCTSLYISCSNSAASLPMSSPSNKVGNLLKVIQLFHSSCNLSEGLSLHCFAWWIDSHKRMGEYKRKMW